MKKKDYSDVLKSPKWQKKRLEIMSRDKFTCKKCGDTETELHIHHKEYINGNDPWDYDNKLLITLCKDCHKQIEDLKMSDPEVPFDKIKIYKSDNWEGGGKIMFVATPGNCAMTIYDEKDGWICGFNFTNDLPNIIKILKQANNG